MAPPPKNVSETFGERRTRDRFSLHLACRFWWQYEDGRVCSATGRTIDLSVEGIRISAGMWPAKGCLLRVEVDMPSTRKAWPYSNEKSGGSALMIEGEGRVVWSSPSQNEFGAQIYFSPISRVLFTDPDAVESPPRDAGEAEHFLEYLQ